MSEPIIHVIPEAYYGGVAPKSRRKAGFTKGTAGAASAEVKGRRSKFSAKVLFFVVVGILLLFVIAGATWYFIRESRQPAPAAALLPETIQSPKVDQPTAASAPAENMPVIPELPPILAPEDAETPALTPVEIAFFDDIDNDGLTQAEEELYHIQSTRPDTDNDGFLDGHEVFHLYNPAGIAPERLEETTSVRRFNHDSFGYSLLVPVSWLTVTSLEKPESIFIQTAAGQQVIKLSARDNEEQTLLEKWYQGQGFSGLPSAWKTNKSGLGGLMSQDGFSAHFGTDKYIYTFEYMENKKNPVYLRTFEMMLNSFKIRE